MVPIQLALGTRKRSTVTARQSSPACTCGFSLIESRSPSHRKHQPAAYHLSFSHLGAAYVNAALCSSIHVMLLLPSPGQLNCWWRSHFPVCSSFCLHYAPLMAFVSLKHSEVIEAQGKDPGSSVLITSLSIYSAVWAIFWTEVSVSFLALRNMFFFIIIIGGLISALV